MLFFFQDLLSPLQLHNLGALLDIPHCLKIICLEMFALFMGMDGMGTEPDSNYRILISLSKECKLFPRNWERNTYLDLTLKRLVPS